MPAVGASATRRLLRTHLVFGANTDVGKTVATAGLLRARLLAGGGGAGAARYVKPLQCGGSDEASVRGWCRPAGDGYADLVSEMKEIKHPFQQGINAQQGIDF